MLLGFKNRSKATLVFMLVLMQLIAPLVHGHAGYDDRADGLHIHFVAVGNSIKASKPRAVALDRKANVRAIEAMAIDISIGIKRKTFPCFAIADLSCKWLSPNPSVHLIEPFTEGSIGLFSSFRLSPPERAPPVII